MSDQTPPNTIAAEIIRTGIERRKRKAQSSLAQAPGSDPTWELVRELRNGLAAAMRVLATNGLSGAFLDEVKRCGIPDGIGVRSQQWLDAHSPNTELSSADNRQQTEQAAPRSLH